MVSIGISCAIIAVIVLSYIGYGLAKIASAAGEIWKSDMNIILKILICAVVVAVIAGMIYILFWVIPGD